ncbi:MAG: family 16 glycosylhydrolase [Proteobacteria bacterium]|nr:family 16 glycosylhydrolase [Pseudomonadota bacterium]
MEKISKFLWLLLTLVLIAAIPFGCKQLGLEDEDDDSDTNNSVTGSMTIAKTWYLNNLKFSFNDDDTYNFSDWIGGNWVVTESGTYSYDGSAKRLEIRVTMDLNVESGFGDGINNNPIFDVYDLKENELILKVDSSTLVSFSTTTPSLPEGDISDDFNDASLNNELWDSSEDECSPNNKVEEKNSVVVQTASPCGSGLSNVSISFNYLGYIEPQIDIEVTSAAHYGGTFLAWKPWNNSTAVHLGIWTTSDAQLYTFAHVLTQDNSGNWTTNYSQNYDSVSTNEFHTFKMNWTGSTIEFFVDGVLKGTYSPSISEIDVNNPGLGAVYILSNADSSGLMTANIDNFSIKKSY